MNKMKNSTGHSNSHSCATNKIIELSFWNMTIPEVNHQIKAFGWREKRQRQYISSLAYKVPQLISAAILDSKKYPEIYEIFPEEFDEKEVKEAQRKLQIQKDMDVFQAWAAQFNKRLEDNGKE